MNMQMEIEDEASPNLFAALPAILWQRRWLLVPPVILATGAGIAAAMLLPAQYESSATVLIESAQLSSDVVGGAMGDIIEQRIARARERVLSRQDLIRAIRANNLYAKQQESKPLSEIVDKMRADTTVAPIGLDADGSGMRAVVQGRNTIALRIAFKYDDPVKAQVIAQQYVNRFLEVDAEATADAAEGAKVFLAQQAAQMQRQLSAIEAQITRAKSDNGALLAAANASTGNPIADAARLDGEIAGLIAQQATLRAGAAAAANGDASVQQAEQAVRILSARYSDSHPDVIAAKAQLESARRAASSTPTPQINPQIAAIQAQINALRGAKSLMLSTGSTTRSAQARAPAIASQVEQLEKQADTLRDRLGIVGTRLQQAEMGARMESDQKGERLTLADPPVVPDTPIWPNRPMLAAMGAAGGLGLGLALVLLFELLMRPIRGAEALRSATGVAPLAIVPDYSRRPHFLIRWLERRNRRRAARIA